MNNETSKIIGAKIRTLRKNKRMSIQELSQQLGISQQHQSRHELGDIRLHVDTLYLIAEIFDVPINELMSDFIETTDLEQQICKQSASHILEAEILLLPEKNF